jgi:MtrB/PioB family decaheme-associated outer membrane protein
MKKRTYLMLLVGLSLPAHAPRAAEARPATDQVDTSQWKCKFCAFEEEGLAADAEGGVGVVSDDSAKFGEYTGLNEEGAFLIGNASVRSRGEDAAYWNLRVRNLGLDSRSLGIDGGRQGKYGLSFDYSALPHFLSDSAVTPFLGDANLTLPAGWVGASTTSAMTALPASLHGVDIETQRKRLGVGASVVSDSRWEYRVNFRRDNKEGHKRSAGAFSFNSAHFLEPIDYETDLIDASAAYTGKRLQARFAYHGSFFRNQIDAQSWQDPYSTTGAIGLRALPPDNQFHQVLASTGYQWTRKTRIMADLALGQMTQDEGFLPATTNAALVVPAAPRASLDGRVNTLTANVKLVSDVTDKLRLNAALMRDDRDNQTPQATYTWVTTDFAVNPALRTNQPYSFTNDTLRASADYRLARRSKVAVGFDREDRTRTYLEATETREDTFWAEAKTSIFDKASFGVKYARSQRDGDYQIVPETNPAQNTLMRKYNMANRDRDVLGARLTLSPTERVTVGLGADMAQDDYSQSVIGVTDGKEASYNVDVSAVISDATSMHVFYNRQKIESSQAGSSVFGAPDWFAENEDLIDTAGIGVKHQMIPERLDVGADYVLSQSHGKIRVATGTPQYLFPELATDLTSVKLYATYRLATALSLNAAFVHETYAVDDWSIDGVTPTTVATVLTLGEQTPDYEVNVITVSMRYAFK